MSHFRKVGAFAKFILIFSTLNLIFSFFQRQNRFFFASTVQNLLLLFFTEHLQCRPMINFPMTQVAKKTSKFSSFALYLFLILFQWSLKRFRWIRRSYVLWSISISASCSDEPTESDESISNKLIKKKSLPPAQKIAQKKRTTKSLGAAVPLPPPPQPDEDEDVAPIVFEEENEEKQYFHAYVMFWLWLLYILLTFHSNFMLFFRLLARGDIELMLHKNGHFLLRVLKMWESDFNSTLW